MIDFRYHLVSIVAVFLALAIGIVLGSTELQGNTIDVLRTTADSLKSQLNASNTERNGYQTQAGAQEQFLTTAEPKLLANELPGMRIVIITEPGSASSVISGVKQAATWAGATVTGQVAIQPAFNDLSGATESSLYQLNSSIATTDQTTLATPSDEQTANQQQAAQLIATAILATTTAGESAGISSADAQTLIAAYAQAGYLAVTDTPYDARATLAVIVTAQTAPTDGQNDPGNQVLLALAQEFATGSAATVVVGSAVGSSPSGSAISVLRSSSVSSEVSSVDNADSTIGQVSTIWALANQLAGDKPNSFGISGASAVSPVPLAVPSATPTITPTPHPTKTGKGGKSVKKK